jgi:hypothetical protein
MSPLSDQRSRCGLHLHVSPPSTPKMTPRSHKTPSQISVREGPGGVKCRCHARMWGRDPTGGPPWACPRSLPKPRPAEDQSAPPNWSRRPCSCGPPRRRSGEKEGPSSDARRAATSMRPLCWGTCLPRTAAQHLGFARLGRKARSYDT